MTLKVPVVVTLSGKIDVVVGEDMTAEQLKGQYIVTGKPVEIGRAHV